MSLTFVQGDTAPAITAVIHDEGDSSSPVDLSGASVRFQMRFPGGKAYKVNAAASIVDAETGQVSYSWGANDLSQPGTYEAQWEVTFADETVQTTTPSVEVVVRRQ